MRIIEAPSPNHNERRAPLDMLVLHYTGMETGEAALTRMRDPAAEVSAHYMVGEDGVICRLVDESRRAWHAGVSNWAGEEDLNSRSIGIEIVNGGHDFPLADGTLPPYPAVQVAALISLIRAIRVRHAIPQTRILGHSDIAPDRKRDPGEHFPWAHLAGSGIGIWPEPGPPAGGETLIGRGLGSGESGAAVARLQAALVAIGYGLAAGDTYDAATEAVVAAFQRRWLQDRVSGLADLATLQRVEQVAAAYASAG